MRRKLRIIWLLALLAPLAVPSIAHTVARSQADSCSEIVRTAFETTSQLCQSVGRNEACYGHVLLQAQPQPNVQDFQFEQEGDVVNIVDMQNLRLSPLDVENDRWGIGLLKFRANISASSRQNATLLLFGDVELENAMEVTGEVELTVSATQNVNVRQAPSIASPVIGTLVPREKVLANGRLADNSWLRVSLPDNAGTGWVYAQLVKPAGDLAPLAVVDDLHAPYGAMQAFYLKTGSGDAVCSEAPDSGIVIQTPEGVSELTLLINEVDIRLGSTVYFQAQPGGEMTLRVVEGSARVEVDGVVQKAFAGSKISVPMDENLHPAGPPSVPEPYDMSEVAALPAQLLERTITVHAPLTEEQVQEYADSFTASEDFKPADDPHYKPPKEQQTPPGQIDNPGLTDNPALDNGVPPGQGGTPPGQGGTAPGQEKTPPGQEKTPPGQDKKN